MTEPSDLPDSQLTDAEDGKINPLDLLIVLAKRKNWSLVSRL